MAEWPSTIRTVLPVNRRERLGLAESTPSSRYSARMKIELLPLAMAAVFVAGGIAIQLLHRWADQVQDALGTVFMMLALLVGAAFIARSDRPSPMQGPAKPAAAAMYGGVNPSIRASVLQDSSIAAPVP